MARRKFSLCGVFAFGLFCSFVVVFGSSGSESESELELNQSQSSNSNLKLVTSSEFSLVLERLEAQQMRIRELEQSHLELKEQFKWSKKRCEQQVKKLRKEVEEMKAENCLNEDVWLLTPPIRGRRGQKGEKGDSGRNGRAGKAGEKGGMGQNGGTGPKGDRGEKGERGQVGPKGQGGRKGEPGPKGERGISGHAPGFTKT